jgi:hypothetical protein
VSTATALAEVAKVTPAEFRPMEGVLRVIYFFAGAERKGDLKHQFQSICQRRSWQLVMVEVDLLRGGKDHDLTRQEVRAQWFTALGNFQVVIVTPPCSNLSRACWANSFGPRPVRSAIWPRGLPGLEPWEANKVRLHNTLFDFAWEILFEVERLRQAQIITAMLEHPEDLGRVPGGMLDDVPASLWQTGHFTKLLQAGWWSGALAQSQYGALTPKPTRLLAPGLAFSGLAGASVPAKDSNNWYTGPLGHNNLPGQASIMRKAGDSGPFRTETTAAYPSALCLAMAEALVRGLDDQAERANHILSVPAVGESFNLSRDVSEAVGGDLAGGCDLGKTVGKGFAGSDTGGTLW